MFRTSAATNRELVSPPLSVQHPAGTEIQHEAPRQAGRCLLLNLITLFVAVRGEHCLCVEAYDYFPYPVPCFPSAWREKSIDLWNIVKAPVFILQINISVINGSH